MKNVSLSGVLELSVEERILFVEEIWDSIAAVPESVSLTEAQRKELDRRLEAYHKNPEAGLLWNEVKASIKSAL